MPYWAEKVGTPRTLAVDAPFGQTLGRPHDVAHQMNVIRQALAVFESASEPGGIAESTEAWPQDPKTAIKEWQPSEPSPIVRVMGPRVREILRERRKKR
jgi:hypothetical protein